MTYCLAIFKSRAQAIDCRDALARAGIGCELVSTPSYVGIGCGLSVKVPTTAYLRARNIITRRAYTQFYGYMNI